MIITFYILVILMGLMCIFMRITVDKSPIAQLLGNILFKLSGLYVIFYSGIQLSKQLGWL